MTTQFRLYTINRGQMDAFVEVWRGLVVPVREKVGFRVEGAWILEQTNQFCWVVSYDGPVSWEEKEREYYSAPERLAMDPDPASFLARAEITLVRPALEK